MKKRITQTRNQLQIGNDFTENQIYSVHKFLWYYSFSYNDVILKIMSDKYEFIETEKYYTNVLIITCIPYYTITRDLD